MLTALRTGAVGNLERSVFMKIIHTLRTANEGKRKSIKGAVITLGILTILCNFFGCQKENISGEKGDDGLGLRAVPNESGAVAFSYSYDGTIGANSYSYDVKREEDGRVFFTYESMEYPDYGEMKREVDGSFLDSLNAVYLEHNLCRWDGYNKYDPYVDDGDGFSVRFTFSDGKSMSAHGSNCYPEGYWEFSEAMHALIDPLVSGMLEEKRQEMIERGFDGTVDFLMVTFIQKGASGSDKYEFLISQGGVRSPNYDVSIHSESGEFLPEGDYRVYREVPDEYIGFDEVQELIDRYSLIEWYNYDKAAEDYNNSEWFQIDFGFTGDSRLSAMGTEPPPHYAEFRHEFLKLMTEKMLKIAELPEE